MSLVLQRLLCNGSISLIGLSRTEIGLLSVCVLVTECLVLSAGQSVSQCPGGGVYMVLLLSAIFSCLFSPT